jgi:hypothetical protein
LNFSWKTTGSPGSLRNLNNTSAARREAIYRTLIPASILQDRRWRAAGRNGPLIRYICPENLGLVRIEVRRSEADRDCLFFMQAADTPYGQLELTLCIINNIDGRRYDIDRDAEGRDNCLGTLTRNIPEEIDAMRAGLCPHQVLPGLGLFREFFCLFEQFAEDLGIDTIVAEPLSYNTALLYEEMGFGYLCGYNLMRRIDAGFRDDGDLTQKLDGSSAFRQPGMNRTVRGRSWAIHDGILECSWDGIRIYKVIGQDAGIRTFSGLEW